MEVVATVQEVEEVIDLTMVVAAAATDQVDSVVEDLEAVPAMLTQPARVSMVVLEDLEEAQAKLVHPVLPLGKSTTFFLIAKR
jgi:hypothetical protein